MIVTIGGRLMAGTGRLSISGTWDKGLSVTTSISGQAPGAGTSTTPLWQRTPPPRGYVHGPAGGAVCLHGASGV